jgi:hypothetical protein
VLPGDGRPSEDLVHRLARATGLGFGDPRLRWHRKLTALAARPGGSGALAEDEGGGVLWIEARTLRIRALPHEPLERERPVARGVLPGNRPWVARRGRQAEPPGGQVVRLSLWHPEQAGAPEVTDFDLGPTIGDPTFVWGLPEGPRVLARATTGDVYLFGPESERPLPALSRGFGRGFTGLPDGTLLGPVRDETDELYLWQVGPDGELLGRGGPGFAQEDRFLPSPDGTLLAVYRRRIQPEVLVFHLPSWEFALEAPLVEGFLGWTDTGTLILGPSETGHLGRWSPGDAAATRLASPPPPSAARYALLGEDPAELLLLQGGRLALHDLSTGARVESAGSWEGVVAPGAGGRWARAGATKHESWDQESGRRSEARELPMAISWILDDGRVAREVTAGDAAHEPRYLEVHDVAGTSSGRVELGDARLLAASGGDPLVLVLRRGARVELRRIDLDSGEVLTCTPRVDPSMVHGGGLWDGDDLAWILTGTWTLQLDEATLAIEPRRLSDGARPPAKPDDPADLVFTAYRRIREARVLLAPPLRDPARAWVWLPDELETRAVAPNLSVTRRLAHPGARGGPLALSPSGGRLARALSDRVMVWDVESGAPLEEHPTDSAPHGLAFLGEDEVLVLGGDRVRSVPLPAG